MALTAQELRCIELVCDYLGSVYGGTWRLTRDLDEENLSTPSPDAEVSNGTITAAVEVKQLMGDASARKHSTSHSWLFKYLAPTYGGRYHLWPCSGFRLPIKRPLIDTIKTEIERVGKKIAPGQNGAIRIARSGEITCISKYEGQFINCWHTGQTAEVVRALSPYVSGIYYLADGEQTNRWHHSFVTDEARRQFQSSLIDACDRSDKGRPVVVDWHEEWKLTRSDTNTEDGVFIFAMHIGWVDPGLCEELQRALDSAAPKFLKRRAETHILVLERVGASNAAAPDVERILPTLSLPGNIDLILLIDGDRVTNLKLHRASAHDRAPRPR